MLDAFAREPNGGLIVLPDVTTMNHREAIITLAARHRLPAMYPFRYFAASGGLMSYGTDLRDVFRRAAAYIDRILKGACPGELPVQAPTWLELVMNLGAAKVARHHHAAASARPRRRGDRMRRRTFITLVGGAAAAWPLAARAQQPAIPLVGFLGTSTANTPTLIGFRRGLGEAGFVEGRNVAVEFRFSEGRYDRLPALVADLLACNVARLHAPERRHVHDEGARRAGRRCRRRA